MCSGWKLVYLSDSEVTAISNCMLQLCQINWGWYSSYSSTKCRWLLGSSIQQQLRHNNVTTTNCEGYYSLHAGTAVLSAQSPKCWWHAFYHTLTHLRCACCACVQLHVTAHELLSWNVMDVLHKRRRKTEKEERLLHTGYIRGKPGKGRAGYCPHHLTLQQDRTPTSK